MSLVESTRIAPADPGAGYRAHRGAIDRAVLDVMASGRYLQAGENAAFEQEFAAYLGAEHAVGAGSGTDALELALRACGLGPEDAVITVANTATATVAAIDLVGATPVLVDVDPATSVMDPESLEEVLSSAAGRSVRAVIPVHLYGHPAEMPAIREIADRHGLYVIEDCAQAHGAEIEGRKTGTWGHAAAFSFYPTKNLGALGDGGALVTGDAKLAERARAIKQYGWRERYVSAVPGMNTRLDEVQAAVLRVKLPYLDRDNERRRRLAKRYDRALASTGIETPAARRDIRHVYHQYVIRTPRRDDLRRHLEAEGIGTAVLYPVPIHLQPGYCDRVRLGPGGLPHTERLAARILSLPIYPELTDAQVDRVAAAVQDWADDQ